MNTFKIVLFWSACPMPYGCRVSQFQSCPCALENTKQPDAHTKPTQNIKTVSPKDQHAAGIYSLTRLWLLESCNTSFWRIRPMQTHVLYALFEGWIRDKSLGASLGGHKRRRRGFSRAIPSSQGPFPLSYDGRCYVWGGLSIEARRWIRWTATRSYNKANPILLCFFFKNQRE